MQVLTIAKMNWSLCEACLVSLASSLHDILCNFLFQFLCNLQKCLLYPGVNCITKNIVGVSNTSQ